MATVTLRPNGAGFQTELYPYNAGLANWQCVDEVVANDDTDHVDQFSSNLWERDLYAIPTSGIPSDATINSVTVYWRAKKWQLVVNPCSGRPSLRTNSVTVDGTIVALTTSWATRNQAWSVNPVTGNPWTVAEINALQIGVALESWFTDEAYAMCTQVYVVVDFTEAVVAIASKRLLVGVGI